MGIPTKGIGRFADHHGAGGRGDPHQGNRTVCGSPRNPRFHRGLEPHCLSGRLVARVNRSPGAGAPRGMRGTKVCVYLCGRGHRRLMTLQKISDVVCARRSRPRWAMIRTPRWAPAPLSGKRGATIVPVSTVQPEPSAGAEGTVVDRKPSDPLRCGSPPPLYQARVAMTRRACCQGASVQGARTSKVKPWRARTSTARSRVKVR